jgi:anaerobic dimethyl sulfoxide reductase subunit B (iron-sulfur subunit)
VAKQYGFYFDADRCVQCRTCEVACKSVRNVKPGTKWRRVIEIWGGAYPNVTRTFFSMACMHCGKPACVEACPTGAISKRGEDGIVVVDGDKCNGCRDCFQACPYGAPQFDDNGIMEMCDFCTRLNMEPACAVSCPAGALKFGTLDELMEIGKGKGATRMSGPTEPSIVVAGELQLSSLVIR